MTIYFQSDIPPVLVEKPVAHVQRLHGIFAGPKLSRKEVNIIQVDIFRVQVAHEFARLVPEKFAAGW